MHRTRPTDLQMKGILTLFLVVLAESVSLSNAVTFWSVYQSQYGQHRGGIPRTDYEDSAFVRAAIHAEKAQECAELTGEQPVIVAQECAAHAQPPSLPATRIYPRSRIAKRVTTVSRFADDCCMECSNCMDPTEAMQKCHVPRGGHMSGASAAVKEAAAETMSATTAAAAEGGSTTPYGIPLHGWKVLFQIFLTAINVLCWLIPLKSKKISENKVALSLANAFSGGVFLSLAFGHLIPECVHGFHGYNEVLPYMLVLGGYLLIFFVEKIAFDAHGALHDMETQQQAQPQLNGGEKENGAAHHHGTASRSSSRSAVILLGALAVHSVLEMTALGLADTFGDCALLSMSIALHQPAESIALLVAFIKSGMPHGQIIQFLSVFSAMGPIGVALGMAVNEFAAPIVDAIMLAVVAGTFVYVGATEVIPEEFEDPEHKWKKFASLMAGIVSIFLITQYTMSLGALD